MVTIVCIILKDCRFNFKTVFSVFVVVCGSYDSFFFPFPFFFFVFWAVTCPNCKFGKAVYHELQTRSADEPMTIFYMCANKNCKHRWNEWGVWEKVKNSECLLFVIDPFIFLIKKKKKPTSWSILSINSNEFLLPIKDLNCLIRMSDLVSPSLCFNGNNQILF